MYMLNIGWKFINYDTGIFTDISISFSAVFSDRTVKVWNLKTGTDLLTLDKHFSYVRCVRYCPRNSLIFTASQSLIKVHVWYKCSSRLGVTCTCTSNRVQVSILAWILNTLVSMCWSMLHMCCLQAANSGSRFLIINKDINVHVITSSASNSLNT